MIADIGAFELHSVRPHIIAIQFLIPLMLVVGLQGRRYHKPQFANTFGERHRTILGDLVSSCAVYLIFRKILARAVLHQCHIAQTETTRRASSSKDVFAVGRLRENGVAVEVFTRVGIKNGRSRLQGRKVGGELCTCIRNLQRNDVKARRLRTTGKCHLIGAIFHKHAAIGEIADVRVAVRFADIEIPSHTAAGVVEVEFEEILHAELLVIHEHLVEVLHRCFGMVPDIGNRLDIAILLAEIVEEPVRLIAVPLVSKCVVVAVAEHADALVEHQFRIGLVSLPLCRLFPCDTSVTHSSVEACLASAVGSVIRGFGVAHVMKRVAYLVSHAMSHRLAGRGIEPECRHLKVIASTVAGPCLGVVHEHHHLILRQIRCGGIDEAQCVEFQIVERLTLC